MKVFVETTPFTDGRIHQEVYSEFEGQKQRLMQFVMNTGETQFKEALIKLGWTPPDKK